MTEGESNLAIIPARKGSKRLPGKNMRLLGGKPLVQYTIDAVVDSTLFSAVIVSSDDDQVLEFCQQLEGVIPEPRNPELAGDRVKVIELVKEIANRPGYAEQFKRIGLFLPTCPFRTAADVRAGYELLTPDVTTVLSIAEFSEPVQISMGFDPASRRLDPEALFSPSPLVGGQTRSQDLENYYRVNGGFYLSWMDQFLRNESFFQGDLKGYAMPVLRSVDIDYEYDLLYAQVLLENGFVS